MFAQHARDPVLDLDRVQVGECFAFDVAGLHLLGALALRQLRELAFEVAYEALALRLVDQVERGVVEEHLVDGHCVLGDLFQLGLHLVEKLDENISVLVELLDTALAGVALGALLEVGDQLQNERLEQDARDDQRFDVDNHLAWDQIVDVVAGADAAPLLVVQKGLQYLVHLSKEVVHHIKRFAETDARLALARVREVFHVV